VTATDDLLDSRPALRPEIRVGPAALHGARTVHLVRNRRTGQFFEVGIKERFIIERLDGDRTLREIASDYIAEFGRRIPDGEWAAILGTLWRRGFLGSSAAPGSPPERGAPPEPGALPAGRDRRGRTALNATLPFGNPQPLLDRVAPHMRWVFHPVSAAIAVLGCVGMLAFLGTHFARLWAQALTIRQHPDLFCVAVLLLWGSSLLHEFSHGLWAHHYGGRATEIGMRWRAPVFMFYCEAEDVLVFRSRRARVSTAAVGVLANLLFLVPFFVLWLALPAGNATHDAIAALLLLGSVSALGNYLPLLKLDGYKMLSHGLDVIDIGPQTWIFLRRGLGRGAGEYPPRARRVYLGYAAVFTVCVAGLTAAIVLAVLTWTSGWQRWAVLAIACAGVLSGGAATMAEGRWPARPRPPGAAAQETAAAEAAPPVPAAPAPSHRPDGALAPAVRPAGARGRLVPAAEAGSTLTDEAPGEPVLIARDVRRRYGDKQVVDGISLTVGQGEIFGVLGPNGAGKTTLIEIMEGQREADSGTVSVFGQSPWPRDVNLYRRIGIQTQTSAFFPELTALEHLEAIAGLYRLPASRAARALELAGLPKSAGTRVERLSGGQRQRLAVASALVHEPELIFLDEPTGPLDPRARRELWNLLRSIQSQGRSIVCTTHYLDEAEALCDRVAIIASGVLLALDTPKNLISASGGPTRISLPQVQLPADTAAALADIAEVRRSNRELVVVTDSPSKALVLLAGVVDFADIETRRPTLEDVYLNLTGTEYAE
jgi:ABC-type multidrug transport system ATPase subunit